MTENIQKISGEVLDSIESSPPQDEVSDLIILSSGVVLRAKKIPIILIQRIQSRMVPPSPPVVFLKEKERNEPNPQDPDFKRRLAQWEMDRGLAILNIFAGYGTELVSTPSSFPGVMDEGWVEDFKDIYEDEIPEKFTARRYLAWLTCLAITDKDDLDKISDAVSAKIGVSASAVVEEMNSFPG